MCEPAPSLHTDLYLPTSIIRWSSLLLLLPVNELVRGMAIEPIAAKNREDRLNMRILEGR